MKKVSPSPSYTPSATKVRDVIVSGFQFRTPNNQTTNTGVISLTYNNSTNFFERSSRYNTENATFKNSFNNYITNYNYIISFIVRGDSLTDTESDAIFTSLSNTEVSRKYPCIDKIKTYSSKTITTGNYKGNTRFDLIVKCDDNPKRLTSYRQIKITLPTNLKVKQSLYGSYITGNQSIIKAILSKFR